MATILDKILNEKSKEIVRMRENERMMNGISFPKRSLIKSIQEAKDISIISEFKRASPSKGVINASLDPVKQAQEYERNGASAISVLTDHLFFQGSFEDLTLIKKTVTIPVLCKDFIIDRVQIDFALASGADLILLIVAAMNQKKLNDLFGYAKSLGLEVLVEVHNREELESALNIGVQLIGINNRDLKTFTVNLEITEKLAPIVKASGALLISESGIHRQEDVDRVRKAGANGILVGEALMKSTDIKTLLADFRLPLIKEVKG